ncbi:peptidase inhibitor family I36 protein [Streptomyces sp. NPDC059690]|uniref:peptidase inhibitor family I36 protein n=1 Tax=Streptomyces sp. NPDC059690 TaxID=3346907 RepID=UPI0036D16572
MNKPVAHSRASARPTTRSRWPATGAVSAVVLALAALTPASANAAGTADCPSGALCLYSDQNFGGDRLTLSSLTGSGTCVSLIDHGWAGRVESAVNTHSASAALFPADDCLGGPYRVDAGTGVPDLGAFAPLSAWVPGVAK